MAQITIRTDLCTRCGVCASVCPFAAIDMTDAGPVMNAACRVCGACVKVCPQKAIERVDTRPRPADLSGWRDILVFAEACGGRVHPVTLELLGKARSLCAGRGLRVLAVLTGSGCAEMAEELTRYGAEEVWLYDDDALSFFRADAFADCVADAIDELRPGIVLIGATSVGRSLAPRLATRFHTGLTADCTRLELRENGDLVQIRPAFGGNIMAQIVTPSTRPQFATVRYKVMDAPVRSDTVAGRVVRRALPAIHSAVRLVQRRPLQAAMGISDAETLVVAGRGFRKQEDLGLLRELAGLLGGEWAVSRPLVEMGWAPHERQIGLSGRTVRPKLILTFGVSGAIQFTSCMRNSGHIIAVNTDPLAPIFAVSHVAVVGDLYSVLTELIDSLKGGACS